MQAGLTGCSLALTCGTRCLITADKMLRYKCTTETYRQRC